MVKVREDMTGWIMSEHGVKKSRLIVIKQAEDYISKQGQHYSQWVCKCDCGNPELIVVRGNDLKNGHTLSCGCFCSETRKGSNIFELNFEDEYGKYGVGYCSNTKSKFYFDMDDYDNIKDYCWHERVQGSYHSVEAWNPKTKDKIKMHWLIKDKYVDHRDRNALNNRKYNLRSASALQNSFNRNITNRNSSGVIGVRWDKKRERWVAHICIDGNKKRLGSFIDKNDAIKRRLDAELEYFNDFAPQRHLFEQYGIVNKL